MCTVAGGQSGLGLGGCCAVLPPPLRWCSLSLISDSLSLLTPNMLGSSAFCLGPSSHSMLFYALSSVSLRSSTSSCFSICICRGKSLCEFWTLTCTCLRNICDQIAQLPLSETTHFPPNRLLLLELWAVRNLEVIPDTRLSCAPLASQ